MITAAEIRQKYVDFFLSKGHRHVSSAPLVPPDDPTLLFTTAGMVQFKANYSGAVPLSYTRAVTVQKCLRAGGKGSDLENVGRTLRHHTFFEMLGNFSFGDYFKKEVIEWAWEFCTGKEWLNLPPERIWPTVFGKPDPTKPGEWIVDVDAENYWRTKTGVINPITRLPEAENFWGPAGSTGACGACSEIKFFMGSEEQLREYQKIAQSGEEGMKKIAHDIVEEGDLFLEIWNLVFPEYDQQPDGSRPTLKNRGIDTGAGLERVTTACQMIASGGKVWSPYETDLLAPIIAKVSEISGLPYPKKVGSEEAEGVLRVAGHNPEAVRLAMNACADHARALTFALSEGIVPSNEGRGYVIRRILRRAARFGKKIGIMEPFLFKMVEPVVEAMSGAYPELNSHPAQVAKTIRSEEERFNRTLHLGSEMLDGILSGRAKGQQVTGDEAFRLYDTYGFPLDLTIEIAEERGVGVDIDGFDKMSAESRKKAKATWKGGAGIDLSAFVKDLKSEGRSSEFAGYTEFTTTGEIIAVIRDGKRVQTLEEGQTGILVLSRTPFYGEGGGQIGDRGVIRTTDQIELFQVEDTQKTDEGFVFHFGHAMSPVTVGWPIEAVVDEARRRATMRNHTATHLLQGALKRIIGGHVTQSGSFVGPENLRFDFTNPEALDEAKLRQIEFIVNQQVQRNIPVTTQVMDLETARSTGAIAPFGEKYGARVRVVKMGDFSTEFCGGTHLSATGEVGPFIITSESSVAAGIRRIEARTGDGATTTIAHDRTILGKLARTLAVSSDEVEDRVATLQSEVKTLKREIERIQAEKAAGAASELEIIKLGEISVCAGWLNGLSVDQLRSTFDSLKSKHQNQKFVALLGSSADGKAMLIAGASPDLEGSPFEAGKLIKVLAPKFEGKGGGKVTFAQAGCKNEAALKSAFADKSILDALKEFAA